MIFFFGDSQTVLPQSGTGNPVPGLSAGWAALVSGLLAEPGTVLAVHGHTVILQAPLIYGVSPSPAHKYRYQIGTNDVRLNGSNAGKLSNFRKAYDAQLGWLALDAKKAKNGGWSYTGSWLDTAVYGIGRRSTTVGNVASFQFTGTAFRLAGIAQNGQTGVATVKVDGVTVATWPQAPAAAIDSPGYMPTAIDVTGLTDTAHTVEIVHTSGNNVYLDYYAALPRGSDVVVGTVPKMSAAGYANYGGSLAATASYTHAVIAAVQQINGVFGASVRVADVYGLINPDVDVMNDGVHIDQSGHWQVARAHSQAIAPMLID